MYCAPANSCKFKWLGISDAVCTLYSVEFYEREKNLRNLSCFCTSMSYFVARNNCDVDTVNLDVTENRLILKPTLDDL